MSDKTKQWLLISVNIFCVIILSCALFFVHTRFEKGIKGDTGEQGEQGSAGNDGEDGKDGLNGRDGYTPYIGENGNWWINGRDTGYPSRGENGQDGKDGKDGKTPYVGDDGYWYIDGSKTSVQAVQPQALQCKIQFERTGLTLYNPDFTDLLYELDGASEALNPGGLYTSTLSATASGLYSEIKSGDTFTLFLYKEKYTFNGAPWYPVVTMKVDKISYNKSGIGETTFTAADLTNIEDTDISSIVKTWKFPMTVKEFLGKVISLTDIKGYQISFPNCDLTIASFNTNNVFTIKDAIGWIAQVAGGMAYLNYNSLAFTNFSKSLDIIKKPSIKEYMAEIASDTEIINMPAQIIYKNTATNSTVNIPTLTVSELTTLYVIDNPLIDGMSTLDKTVCINNILDCMQVPDFTAWVSAIRGYEWFNFGDVVKINNSNVPINYIAFTLTEMRYGCYVNSSSDFTTYWRP